MATLRPGDAAGDFIGQPFAWRAVNQDQARDRHGRQKNQKLHASGRHAVEQPLCRRGQRWLQGLERGLDIVGGLRPSVVHAVTDEGKVGDKVGRLRDAQRGLTFLVMEKPGQTLGQRAGQQRPRHNEGQQGDDDQQHGRRFFAPTQPMSDAMVDGRQGDGQDDGPQQQPDERFGDPVAPIDQAADEADPDEEVKQATREHLLKIDIRTKAHDSVSEGREQEVALDPEPAHCL